VRLLRFFWYPTTIVYYEIKGKGHIWKMCTPKEGNSWTPLLDIVESFPSPETCILSIVTGPASKSGKTNVETVKHGRAIPDKS